MRKCYIDCCANMNCTIKGGGFISGSEVAQARKAVVKLTTGSKELDKLLGNFPYNFPFNFYKI